MADQKTRIKYEAVFKNLAPEICTYFAPRSRKPEGLITDLGPEVLVSDGLTPDGRAFLPHRSSFITGEHDRFHVYFDGKAYLANLNYRITPTLEHRQSLDYWGKVDKLQRSPAGKKATALLKEFLNEGQRDELDNDGLFVEQFAVWALVQGPWPLDKVWTPVTTGHWTFFVEPGCSTFFSAPSFSGWLSMCWHPKEPMPAADIILSHFLYLQNNGKEAFLKKANW